LKDEAKAAEEEEAEKAVEVEEPVKANLKDPNARPENWRKLG